MSRQLGDTAEAKALDSARKQLKECRDENQRLRDALEWYADSPACGKAREALAGDAE